MLLRLWPRPALWLDEAQSVAFAREALTDIPNALREDGAPPLYYMLLHLWVRAFGDGDAAVRSLTVVTSLALIAAVAFAAWRLGGAGVARAAVFVTALNPFAIRYATETRMYALVALEVALGLVAVSACLRRPSLASVGAIAIATAALLYTHYWAMYLLGVTAAALLAAIVVERRRSRHGAAGSPTPLWWALSGIAAGAVLWLPWLPAMRFQMAHTATPWTDPSIHASAWTMLRVASLSEGHIVARVLLSALVVLLPAFGIVAARRARSVGLRRRDVGVGLGALGAVAWGTLVVAIAGAVSSDSAYALRYTSVAFPLLMVLIATGLAAAGGRVALALLVVIGVAGVTLTVRDIGAQRTRAGDLAAVIVARARPGDSVVYCPDQLAPAMSRLLERSGTDGVRQFVFPAPSTPERVNWIDYVERYDTVDPRRFAAEVDRSTPDGTIWLVWSGTYPVTQNACTALARTLQLRRPQATTVIADDPSVPDHGALLRLRP